MTRLSTGPVPVMERPKSLEQRRSTHAFLRELCGERFEQQIQRPIEVIQRAMRQFDFTAEQAVAALQQRAMDRDPTGSVGPVTWLDAALVEILEGETVL